MNKSQLRQSAIAQLRQLDISEKENIEQKLLEHLMHSSIWKQAHTIGITISRGFEWNTGAIIETAWKQNKAVYVPKCFPDNRNMIFYKLTSFQELEVVYYNLQEPKPIETNKINKNSLDMIIVPGLLFDRSGYRIGFGGGYYDRFLTDYKGHTVALTASQQLMEKIPNEPHDIAVKHIITESDIINVE